MMRCGEFAGRGKLGDIRLQALLYEGNLKTDAAYCTLIKLLVHSKYGVLVTMDYSRQRAVQ